MKDNEIEGFVREQSIRIGIDEPTITYRKMRRFFGVAHPHSWRISLNRSWVHKAHDAVVKDVLMHELMHLAHYWIYGESGHNKRFYELCARYGCHAPSVLPMKVRREIVLASKREK